MSARVTPVSVQIPSDPRAAIVADFPIHALRVAYVSRDDVEQLAKDWNAPGVYLLCGAPLADGRLPVYVGKSVELRKRLVTHRRKPKLAWIRAILVRRDTSDGFNSAEVGYLEGRIAAELRDLVRVVLHLEKEDLDTTLPSHMLPVLDAFVPTILAAARLGGLHLATPPEQPRSANSAPRQTFDGTVADLLAAGLLAAGAELACRRGERTARARVTSDGELIVNGKAYTSPSTAAAQGLNVQSMNGWTGWRVDEPGGETLAALRAQLPDRPARGSRAME